MLCIYIYTDLKCLHVYKKHTYIYLHEMTFLIHLAGKYGLNLTQQGVRDAIKL